MAKQYPNISPELRRFIEKQKIFFTASAAADGRVNLSPKGLDGLRVLSESQIAYLDLTGSGNETAAHLKANNRLTVMVCAFEGAPQILRLYGQARVLQKGTRAYAELLASAFDGKEPAGARQIVLMDVEMAQTSCGYGVPVYDYKGERESLVRWAEAKGEDGIVEYQRKNNQESIDGLPTGWER